MTAFGRVVWLTIVGAVLIVAGWSLPARGETGSEPEQTGVEVRLAGRLHEDGRIEVALQTWWNGQWSRGVFPSRRYLPADAVNGRWLASAPVRATSFQSQVRLSVEYPRWDGADGPGELELRIDGQRYRSNCGHLALEFEDERLRLRTRDAACAEDKPLAAHRLAIPTGQGRQDVRIAARRGAGRVQLAVQHREGSGWSERLIPADSRLPERMRVGRWYHTFTVVLPPPPAALSGQLHRAASLALIDGDFQIETDDRRFHGNCGVLELRAGEDAILVDSMDAQCAALTALATICGPDVHERNCDVQRNHAYEWERAWLQLGGAEGVRLELSEARALVDAIYRDYFPNRPHPPRVVRTSGDGTHYDAARHRIQLADWAMTLDAVLHETAHALIDSAGVDDPGHGARYLALLLELWQRYLPIVDTNAARTGALAAGLEVEDSVRPLLMRVRGPEALRDLICDHSLRSERLCRSLAGELDAGPMDGSAGGLGGSLGELWWLSRVDADTGVRETTLVRESTEQFNGVSLARLSISCESDDQLELAIWWRDLDAVSPRLSFRIGDGSRQSARWRTFSGGTWSGDEWAGHQALDAASFLQALNWRAAIAGALHVQFAQSRRVHRASFELRGLFSTPVQSALVRCGAERPARDSNAPIVDWGRFGADLWWGVAEDDEPPRTYVVSETTISGTDREARLQLECQQGELGFDVYWAVDEELARTVVYQIAGGPPQREEWTAGWARWGDVEYKWTGPEDAAGLVAELAWAAQNGGALVVEAHERGNPNRRYSARFELAGIFATPVQPNLVRCAR
ncbi:MAG: hypothetical protein F4209_08345 [Chloroflexi bacterium]|nr:hypothetical protein [Chloroflexota bacterium]MYF22746.1 hypothetical protein [Chloroflexota bacterium]